MLINQTKQCTLILVNVSYRYSARWVIGCSHGVIGMYICIDKYMYVYMLYVLVCACLCHVYNTTPSPQG